MTAETFGRELERYWKDANRHALELKDSYRALEIMRTLYQHFSESERNLADDVLCSWAVSEDEKKRFAAMHLITHFRISRAVPALEQLIDQLESSQGPGAPFERDKARRIVRKLSAEAAGAGRPS